MVTIQLSDVADALHLDGETDLPTGADADVSAAETMVGAQVEPYIDDSALVAKICVYVACAFITGTEGDNAISSIQKETATISYDTDTTSPESQSYWHRAKAMDTSNRLGRSTMTFKTHGSQRD